MLKLKSASKGKSILVMGGLGFIGSHLCRRMLQDGFRVRVFDKLYSSIELVTDIASKLEIIQGQIERENDVLKALEGIDIAIDLIHTTVPGSSMLNPVYDVQSNLLSHVAWLSCLKRYALKKIVYVSSGGTVYGMPNKVPISEGHQTDPICSYGITKLAIEKYVAMYSNRSNIEYRICRPANVYGEGQRLHIGQGIIGVIISRALLKEEIEIWGDGSDLRDYLHVQDLVESIVALIYHNGKGRVFNVSSGIGYSINDIIDIVANELDLSLKVKYVESRGYDLPINVLDSTMLRKETRWAPRVGLREGIRRVLEWVNRNMGNCLFS